MTVFLRRLVVGLILVVGMVPVGRAQSLQAATTTLPTFNVPVISGIQGYGFEEDLRVDPRVVANTPETIYTSSPNSLSSGTSFVWRSKDGGQTFKYVPAAAQPNGKLPTCIGGGDTELAVDSAGHLYFNDLTLANFTTARSDDEGVSFPYNSCAGTPTDVGVDRQWYAAQGDPTNGGHLYLTYDRIVQTNPVQCPNGTSAAPGQNIMVFSQSPAAGAAGATAGVEFAPSQPVSCDEGIMGNNEYYTYAGTGTRVFAIHDNIALNSISMARCDVVAIDATHPSGFANCVDTLISSFPGSLNLGATGATGANFPTLTIDKAGNLFAIWEQTDGSNDTLLKYATSSDQGQTWSVPSQLPTPGLNTNVFAWPAAGDAGKIDVAWYGTAAKGSSPDVVNGDWGVYMVQTLDGGATWTAPILTTEHFTHRGSIQTLIGNQTGDRTLGDFIQLRIGHNGQAEISYADSNSIDEAITPHAMFVQQNSGASVFNNNLGQPQDIPPTPKNLSSATDPAGDATFSALGATTPNNSNLDILGSSVTAPDSTHYQFKMTINDLSTLTTSAATSGGTTAIWQTQWLTPSTNDSKGGKNFFVYMESVGGGAPTCWFGQNALEFNGGGALYTYPGTTQITGTDCAYSVATGTITITIPKSFVSTENPIDQTLYSVTTSTQTITGNAETPPNVSGIGGNPPNLVDVAPSYDATPSPTAARVTHFAAQHKGRQVVLRWTVPSSAGVIGFNLTAGTHLLNRHVIAVQNGHAYRFTTRWTRERPFALHVLLEDGTQTSFLTR